MYTMQLLCTVQFSDHAPPQATILTKLLAYTLEALGIVVLDDREAVVRLRLVVNDRQDASDSLRRAQCRHRRAHELTGNTA